MQKLIDKFKAEPTKANAVKIANHAKRHMMAIVLLSVDDQAEFDRAWVIAKSEG
jgi:hypothetical protein